MLPVPVRLAATLPINALFKDLLGIETLMIGFGLPDEDVHAPNEFFAFHPSRSGCVAG